MAVELIRAFPVNRRTKVARYGFGRPFRAVLLGVFPRAEALRYFVEPFNGRSLPLSLLAGGFRCS
jgi:hypothetical protein